MIKFIIARMDNQASWRSNPQANAIGDLVTDVEKFDLKGANIYLATGLDGN
jgi:hypothetical protein